MKTSSFGMIQHQLIRLLVFCFFCLSTVAVSADTCTSRQDGNWSSSNRWNCGSGSSNGPPQSVDNVVIDHNVSLNTTTTVASVTVNDTLRQTGTSTRALTVTGSFTNNGTVNDNGSSGRFDLSVGSGFINNSGSFTVDNLSVVGSTTISSAFTVNDTFVAQGALTKNSGNFSVGTLILDATGAQSVTFYGTNTVGNLIVNAGAAVASNNYSTLDISGNFTNSGSLSLPFSRFTFNGGSAQLTAGNPFTLLDLTLNNASGLSLGANATLNGVLTFTDGRLSTGSNVLLLNNTCTGAVIGSNSSRYVIGNVRLTFPAWSVSCVYPVGTGTSAYAPITVTVPSFPGISGGTLTGTTVGGEHPQVVSSGIDSNKNVNRYWNLGVAGDTMRTLPAGGSYNLSLDFVAADVDSGANVSTFKVATYNGAAWSALAGSASGSTATVAGQTIFGSYAVGPPVPTVPVLTKDASASYAAVGDLITFTISAQNLTGSTMTNVVVTDALPTGMSYATNAATEGSVSVAGNIVTWTLLSLAPGTTAQLTLVVALIQQGSLTNTATSPGSTPASASVLVIASAITHFRLDEPAGSWSGAAGEVIDSGGTALHGRRVTSTTPTTTNTVVPNPTIPSQYPAVKGSFCNAGRFDGNAVVEVAESALFDYTTQLSASAWIYPTAYPSELSSILSNDQNYEFHLNSSGRLYWWWGASNFTSAGVIPLNQWTHIAITLDSSASKRRQRIYINGVLDPNTNNWQGTLAANPCKFYIGGDVATGSCAVISGRNFRGSIDEVKLYNYELSAAEVQADMTLGRNCSGGFDHIRIEHSGSGSICTPEAVTVKACLNSSCSTIYPGNVTVNLSPTGWVGGNTIVLNNGIGSASLSKTTSGNVTLGVTSAVPSPANGARCFNGATETCTLNFANASCQFDAVQPAANPKTRIYTKLAGTAFSLDVLALSGSIVNTSYQGTVVTDLVDASTSSCPTGAGLTTAQNLTFVTANAGRKSATFTYPGVAKNVRVRMTSGGTPACSTDNFAIRPSSVTLSTSANATPPSAASTPTIKAGASFNLSAAATTGYGGDVTLDPTKLNAQTTTQDTSIANGGVVGTLTPTTLTVNQSPVPTANATYSEVGYLYLPVGSFRDQTFTAVDQPAGCATTNTCDCITDATNDNYLSTSLVGTTGRYGCYIGNNTVSLGRFTPDHFAVTPVSIAPACASLVGNEFTYFGQDGFTTSFTLMAQNTGNTTTQNYTGPFARLNLGTWNNFGFSASVLPTGSTLMASTTTPTGSWLAGQASVSAKHQASRPATPAGVSAIKVSALPVDSDSVTMPSAVEVQTATTSLKYGQLRLANAFGSEKSALGMPVRAEYWSGKSWVINNADGCTSIPSNAFALSGSLAGNTSASAVALVNGIGTLVLAKPSPTATGSVDVAVNLGTSGNDQSCLATHGGSPASMPWLRSRNGNCATTYDRDPSARATFGIYAPETRRTVHTRELY